MEPGSVLQVEPGIWRVANQIYPSNSYICATGADTCFLVDPGTDGDAIDRVLDGLGLKPRHIFCTHGHFDHVGSAVLFQEKYGIPCYLHGADRKILRASNFLLMAFKIPFSMRMPRLEEARGLVMALGGTELRVIDVPGHTPGGCFLQYGRALFTGDSLYAHGVGLSRLPGGDAGQIKDALLGLWDQIPEEAMVLPGHGDCATFGRIRRENRPLLEFLGLAAQA